MRRNLTALGLLLLATPILAEESDKEVTVRAMTFNIRYDNPNDGVNVWPERRDWVAEIIREHEPDVLGLQEVLIGQMRDLEKRLPNYTAYFVGRDDGGEKGEASPVLFRKDRFELLEQSTFWLSPEPDTAGSRGWDAALPRVCSWVKLKHRMTGREFFAFNTHFDHIGVEARHESAKLLVDKIREIAGDSPALLSGDFNCRSNAPPYLALTEESDGLLRDTRNISQANPEGPNSTWNGFVAIIAGQRIDYIFVTPQFKVTTHRTLTDSRDGRFPSDHLPVIVDLRLP